MVSYLDYAALSAFIYNDARGDGNLIINTPGGEWEQIDYK